MKTAVFLLLFVSTCISSTIDTLEKLQYFGRGKELLARLAQDTLLRRTKFMLRLCQGVQYCNWKWLGPNSNVPRVSMS